MPCQECQRVGFFFARCVRSMKCIRLLKYKIDFIFVCLVQAIQLHYLHPFSVLFCSSNHISPIPSCALLSYRILCLIRFKFSVSHFRKKKEKKPYAFLFIFQDLFIAMFGCSWYRVPVITFSCSTVSFASFHVSAFLYSQMLLLLVSIYSFFFAIFICSDVISFKYYDPITSRCGTHSVRKIQVHRVMEETVKRMVTHSSIKKYTNNSYSSSNVVYTASSGIVDINITSQQNAIQFTGVYLHHSVANDIRAERERER